MHAPPDPGTPRRHGACGAEGKRGPAPARPQKEQKQLTSDLHWLIHQGHVLEFSNGIIETAKKPKKNPSPPLNPKPPMRVWMKLFPSRSQPKRKQQHQSIRKPQNQCLKLSRIRSCRIIPLKFQGHRPGLNQDLGRKGRYTIRVGGLNSNPLLKKWLRPYSHSIVPGLLVMS